MGHCVALLTCFAIFLLLAKSHHDSRCSVVELVDSQPRRCCNAAIKWARNGNHLRKGSTAQHDVEHRRRMVGADICL